MYRVSTYLADAVIVPTHDDVLRIADWFARHYPHKSIMVEHSTDGVTWRFCAGYSVRSAAKALAAGA